MTVVRFFLVYTNDHQPVTDESVLAEVSGKREAAVPALPDCRAPGFATGELTIEDAGELTDVAFSSTFDPITVRRDDARSSSSPTSRAFRDRLEAVSMAKLRSTFVQVKGCFRSLGP